VTALDCLVWGALGLFVGVLIGVGVVALLAMGKDD
jgi:inorganic pyrophosphatase